MKVGMAAKLAGKGGMEEEVQVSSHFFRQKQVYLGGNGRKGALL